MSTFANIVSTWYASGGIGGALANAFYAVLYTIGSGLCWVVGILSQFFSVMSGMVKVRYDGAVQTLMDVFFGNTVVEKLYWAMALIGILLCFVFAIIAVARKSVDSGEKMRQSMGGILTGMFKGMLIIICLTFILNAVLSLSDKLLTQINYAFNHADSLGQEDTIEFKDDQYAAMARVLDTIGNYSLNPSYNSRYNLNNCYNEIRADLQDLTQQGVFDFYYVDGDSGPTWQSALQGIVNAADLNEDLDFDVYNTAVSDALLNCMEIMRTDSAFAPLRSYTRQYSSSDSTNVPLDRIVILMCTLQAAKNSIYNDNASLDDPLRAPYYIGEKSVYNYAQMSSDFDMSSVSYILMIIVACKLIWDLAVIILDCIARIFNMIFLYLVAPPFISVMPLDEGGKFKQWMTAFVVQCFGVFGTVIAMRVLLIFIPIIADSSLVLFDNAILNQLGKLALILGGMSTAKRASSVITGILADSAGYQAINASNLGDSVRNTMDHLRNRVTGFGNVGELGKNGLGIRSLYDKKEKAPKQASRGGGGAPGKAPISGDEDNGWEAPDPPEVPPMPIGDWRGETTEGPEVPPMPVGDWRGETTEGPEAPPVPQWNPVAQAQTPPIPEAPPVPQWNPVAQAQTPPIPEAPQMPGGDWQEDMRQQEGVPEAPPMPQWNPNAKTQAPVAPPMPSWNANANAQVPEAPPMPSWNPDVGAQVASQPQQPPAGQPVQQQPIVPPVQQPPAGQQ